MESKPSVIKSTVKKYRKCNPKMVLSIAAWCTWKVLGILNHVIMFGTFLFALIWSEQTKSNLQSELVLLNITGEDRTFLNEWKYLTRWNHIVQLIFFGLCIIADVQRLLNRSTSGPNEKTFLNKLGEKPSKLNAINDYTFHCFAFPLSVAVSFMYWMLKFFALDMLSPISSNANVPKPPEFLNQILHTLVLVAVLLELFLVYRKRPTWKSTVFCPSAFLITYLTFATLLRFLKGVVVYEIFRNNTYLVILYILIPPLMGLLALIVNTIFYWFWSDERIRSYRLSPNQLQFENNKVQA